MVRSSDKNKMAKEKGKLRPHSSFEQPSCLRNAAPHL